MILLMIWTSSQFRNVLHRKRKHRKCSRRGRCIRGPKVGCIAMKEELERMEELLTLVFEQNRVELLWAEALFLAKEISRALKIQ